MDTFNTWGEIMVRSLETIWFRFVAYLPQIMGAILLLIIGLVIAAALGRLAKKLFSYTKIDDLAEKIGIRQDLERFNIRFSFAAMVGAIVRWFFIIITLITIVDVLNIPALTAFLNDAALYLPNVVIALVIISIGLVAGSLIHDFAKKALGSMSMPDASVGIMAGVIKWSIFIFALMASLVQLGVASSLIQILFAGMIIMMALAGGIAFGLGGRDKAAEILNKIEKELKGRKDQL